MYNPFYNEGEQRIRAGWRLLLQFFLMFAGTVFFLLPLSFFGWAGSGYGFSLSAILPMAAGTVFSVWLAGRYLDLRPFRAFGQSPDRENIQEFGVGLLLGLGGISFIFLLEWLAGWVSITGYGWERPGAVSWGVMMAEFLIAMVLVGYYEELMYRGYQVINLAEGVRHNGISPRAAVIPAVVLSSIFFGLMHAGNPNAGILSTLNIMVAGAVFAVPFVMTGRIGCSVGIHVSWNAAQGGLFGFAVSGIPFRGSLLQTDQDGPELFTGGAFGPEAGVAGLTGLVLVAVLFVIWLRFSHGWPASIPLFDRNRQRLIKTDEQGS